MIDVTTYLYRNDRCNNLFILILIYLIDVMAYSYCTGMVDIMAYSYCAGMIDVTAYSYCAGMIDVMAYSYCAGVGTGQVQGTVPAKSETMDPGS